MPTGEPTPAPVQIHVLDAGLISCSDFSVFSPSVAPGTHRQMTVRSYLIVHPHGVLLWDTGIADAIADRPDGEPVVDGIVFRVLRTLRGQLDAIGLDPATSRGSGCRTCTSTTSATSTRSRAPRS